MPAVVMLTILSVRIDVETVPSYSRAQPSLSCGGAVAGAAWRTVAVWMCRAEACVAEGWRTSVHAAPAPGPLMVEKGVRAGMAPVAAVVLRGAALQSWLARAGAAAAA